MQDEVPTLRLNQEGQITLPMILAFADDLLIIAVRVEGGASLSYVGLNLNDQKCKVLVREPNGVAINTVTINGKEYATTEPLRYLGAYFTSTLDRPMTIRTRCRSSVRVANAIMQFLKKYKPSWNVARAIYEIVIAPAMIYGTQVAVLTKYSRRSIRGYEEQIVRGMVSLSRLENSETLPRSVSSLLQKRRITKKIRVYQLRWWGHVQRREQSHVLRAAVMGHCFVLNLFIC